MNAILIMVLFGVIALSLYFTASKKSKLAGGLDVVGLCLIVAIAYQFELMSTIIWVIVSIVVVLALIFFLMRKRQKRQGNKIIENKGEE